MFWYAWLEESSVPLSFFYTFPYAIIVASLSKGASGRPQRITRLTSSNCRPCNTYVYVWQQVYTHTPLRLRRNQRRKARSPGFFSDLQTRGDERRNVRGKRRDTKQKQKKLYWRTELIMHSTLLWTKVLAALHSYMISSAHKPPLGNLSPPPTPKLSLSLFFFSGFVVLVFFFWHRTYGLTMGSWAEKCTMRRRKASTLFDGTKHRVMTYYSVSDSPLNSVGMVG